MTRRRKTKFPTIKPPINLLKWKFWIWLSPFELRNRSALAVNCWVIIHCLGVSCKGDQITSAKRKRFICLQLIDKQWIILPTFRHWTEEIPPNVWLLRKRLHVFLMFTTHKKRLRVIFASALDLFFYLFEPYHEIMILFVLRKLVLQTQMRSHPVGLDVWFLVWAFV